MSCGAVVEFRPRAAACKVNSLSEALVDSLQPAPVKLLMWTGDEQKRWFLRWMRRHEAHLQSSFPADRTATLGHSVPSYTGVLVPWHKSSLRDVGCVSEMLGVRCAQRGRPTTGFPPFLSFFVFDWLQRGVGTMSLLGVFHNILLPLLRFLLSFILSPFPLSPQTVCPLLPNFCTVRRSFIGIM